MQDSELRENVISREVIYPGKVIHVEKWQVTLPDGGQAPREIVLHRGASAVVALDEAGNIILVRQHRVAIDRITLEIPAGKLDTADEDPFLCAKRELEEETGLHAEDWEKLLVLDTTPGFCNEHIHLYLATGLHAGEKHPDADEFIAAQRMPLTEALQKVLRGEFHDGKTVVGILMTAQKMGLSSI
ncbi:MAG: NUDIX hydrolase [Clostridia bacterium]|nr:NUDIX hydrolase [Clostridia bacterium]